MIVLVHFTQVETIGKGKSNKYFQMEPDCVWWWMMWQIIIIITGVASNQTICVYSGAWYSFLKWFAQLYTQFGFHGAGCRSVQRCSNNGNDKFKHDDDDQRQLTFFGIEIRSQSDTHHMAK